MVLTTLMLMAMIGPRTGGEDDYADDDDWS